MKLNHAHHVHDKDNERYWNKILAYLHLKQLPELASDADKIRQRAQRFFIMEGVLWHRNGENPPLLVILNQEVQMRIAKNAHNDLGHQG